MSQANHRHMMTEIRPIVYSHCRQCQRVKLCLKVLNSSADRQLCDKKSVIYLIASQCSLWWYYY